MEAPRRKDFNLYLADDVNDSTTTFTFSRVEGASKVVNFRSPDYYVFLLFVKSSGVHTVDFVEYKEGDMQLHISFPGQVHSWETGEDTFGYKLYISKSMMESFSAFENRFFMFNMYPVIDVPTKMFRRLRTEFLAMERDLVERDVPFSIISMRAELITMFATSIIEAKFGEDLQKGCMHPTILKFLSIVEKHFRKNKNVGFYARQLALSANYLGILFHKYNMESPKDIIRRRLFLEAKRLLGASEKSMKEIAFGLGFANPSHFTSFIKMMSGKNPKEFRKWIRAHRRGKHEYMHG